MEINYDHGFEKVIGTCLHLHSLRDDDMKLQRLQRYFEAKTSEEIFLYLSALASPFRSYTQAVHLANCL